MMKSLLEKVRRLTKMLESTGTDPVSFQILSKELSEILDANVYISNINGKVLGFTLHLGECGILQNEIVQEKRFPKKYHDQLLAIDETSENIEEIDECVFDQVSECPHPDKIATVIPIRGGGYRLGTLLLARFGRSFTDDDLILAEYSAAVVGMEILRSKTEEIEEEARKKAVIQMAVKTLSYSEMEAIEHIFNELDGEEGLLVASKIADRAGITRSVIVNALRKFESAGLIESRSLGMKGTHIKVLNDRLLEELKKMN